MALGHSIYTESIASHLQEGMAPKGILAIEGGNSTESHDMMESDQRSYSCWYMLHISILQAQDWSEQSLPM